MRAGRRRLAAHVDCDTPGALGLVRAE